MVWGLIAGMEFRGTRDIMDQTALFVGTRNGLGQVEATLEAATRPPAIVASLFIDELSSTRGKFLEHAIERLLKGHAPDVGLICLPSCESGLLVRIRTILRKHRVADRFLPAADDLLAGVGPRSEQEIDFRALLDRPDRPLDVESIKSLLQDRRVLITGAGGSIGRELARIVAEHAPETLVLMDRCEHALFEVDRRIARWHPDLERVASLQDVADPEGTKRLFCKARPHVVLHAAAHKHVPLSESHPAEAVRNNLAGSISAVHAAMASGAEKFVLVSTDKAASPQNVMGATKRLAELAVQRIAADGGMSVSVVRFGNVLGSSGSVLEIWKDELREGGPITVTDPNMSRYLMTIPEAAGLVLQAAAYRELDASPGLVNVLDMGEPVSILDLAGRFLRLHGFEPVLPESPADGVKGGQMPIVFTGIRPGEKMHEILIRPGGILEETDHPAIQAWIGPLPPRGQTYSVLERVMVQASSLNASVAAGEVFSGLEALDRGDPAPIVHSHLPAI